MLQFLLDTDHLTLYERGDPTVVARVDAQAAIAACASAPSPGKRLCAAACQMCPC